MSERKTRWKPGSDFMSSAAAIWMVPLLALFIGAWMLFQHWYSQGPSFTLTVATAEGIVAGKTVIRSARWKWVASRRWSLATTTAMRCSRLA